MTYHSGGYDKISIFAGGAGKYVSVKKEGMSSLLAENLLKEKECMVNKSIKI